MTFGLNVVYTLKPGKRAEYLEALHRAGMPGTVRREEGCLGYDYYLDTQDPDKLLLVERWESRAAQQLHLRQPHMAAAIAMKRDYVADTVLTCYEVE